MAGNSPIGRPRLAIYEAVRQTALAQLTALEQEDFDTFHELMIERDALIQEAEEIPPGRIEPADRVASTDLIREILALDEANQARLATQIETTERELGAIRGGQQVLHRYSHIGAPREARFVDRRT